MWPRHFRLVPPSAREVKTKTLSQRYFLRSQPYYYMVLLSPFLCVGLIFFLTEGYVFLLCLHSWILFGTITILSKDASVRYLQPMSLLTILIFAALVKAVIDRRSQPTTIGMHSDSHLNHHQYKKKKLSRVMIFDNPWSHSYFDGQVAFPLHIAEE